jgi:GH35 family endo-1,4-beta-xylanase
VFTRCVLAVLLALPIVSRDPAPPPTRAYRAASPEYGMHVFPWFHPTTSARDFGRVADAGFTWAKILVPWRAVQPDHRGQFIWDEADRVIREGQALGLELIARIDQQPRWSRADRTDQNGPPDDPDDLARFVHALAARYRSGSPVGHIRAIEVWNEPNTTWEWGGDRPDPHRYADLLRRAFQAAKRADPSVTIVSAGFNPTSKPLPESMPEDEFLRAMYANGARDSFDVLGLHAPGYLAPPEMSPHEVQRREDLGSQPMFSFRRVEQIRAVMEAHGDGHKQVWITEFGWTSNPHRDVWWRVDEEAKAEYLVRAFQWARQRWTPWIGVMIVWTLADPDWRRDDEKFWYAIADADGSSRPAYDRLREARRTGLLPDGLVLDRLR